MLRATKPEKKEKRLKMFVYGPAGVGKTTAALQFPHSYIIDAEKGTDFYHDTINKANSVVFQSNLSDEIKQELVSLLTQKHHYKTLIIDPVTQIYNSLQEKWTKIFEKNSPKNELGDFGMRFWPKVKGEMKAIHRIMLQLDMNVIVTAHQKDVYGNNFSKIGVSFDSMKGDDYLFDLIFQIEKRGNKRMAVTIKERAEIGQNKFPEEFEWTYDNFLKFYGQDIIEKESRPIELATPEQVREIVYLTNTYKVVGESDILKWFAKENIDEWNEMQKDKIQKCIDFIKSKIEKE